MGNASWPGMILKKVLAPFLMLLVFCAPLFAQQESNAFHIGGYVRTWAMTNLEDVPETKEDDKWDFSMLRGSLLLDAEQRIDKTPIGPIGMKVIGRLDREIRTNYLSRLQDLDRNGTNTIGATGGQGSSMIEDIYNEAEVREWYVDMAPHDRLQLRLGKQQVVWGETDFFRAMDVVHGYDYRWRFFMEPENEELRKPLILANARIQVPEASGSLQLLYRPGWDRDKDIGNTYDVSGGRYDLASLRGLDFRSSFRDGIKSAVTIPGVINAGDYIVAPGTQIVGDNSQHHDGDADDPTYGARWSGTSGPVGYSLAYLKTFSADPVENTASRIGGHPLDGIEPANGALIETIHTEIDVYGLTLNGYVPPADAVFSTEIVFTKDQTFNSQPTGNGDVVSPMLEMLMGLPIDSFDYIVPGTVDGYVLRKDVLKTMLRMDKTFAVTQQLLGTAKPAFFSVQLFDEWILDFDDEERIIDLLSFGAPQKEHSTMLTAILALSYRNESINPMFAVGQDITYDGTFFFPSCEFVFGNHWRARLEANFFFNKHEKPANVASDVIPYLNERPDEQSAHLMDYLANDDSLLLRLTYQF